VLGIVDADVAGWLRSDLSRVLSRRARLRVRDRWIAEAARYVSDSAWNAAVVLEREIARFRRTYGRIYGELPADAGPVDVCLHVAARAAELPRTASAIYRILTS
jgi:hypothetical protein